MANEGVALHRLARSPAARLALCATAFAVAPACLAFSLFGGSGIGSIVYDPTNHLETAVSAEQAVRQTALQVRAEIQRLQQLAVELQQLKALPRETVQAALADWSGQLGVLAATAGQLHDIDTQLLQSQQRSADQLRQISALGVSPRAWLAAVAERAARSQQGAETLFSAERQGLAMLANSRVALTRLQAQIPASAGVQQSMQTTNQYLDLLAGQSAQLLQLGATQAADQARQRSLQQADQAQASAREADRISQDLRDITTLRTRLRAREAAQGWGVLQPLPDTSP